MVTEHLAVFVEGMGGMPGRCWVLRVGRAGAMLGQPRFTAASTGAYGQDWGWGLINQVAPGKG